MVIEFSPCSNCAKSDACRRFKELKTHYEEQIVKFSELETKDTSNTLEVCVYCEEFQEKTTIGVIKIIILPCENVEQICARADTCEKYRILKKQLTKRFHDEIKEHGTNIRRVQAVVDCRDYLS